MLQWSIHAVSYTGCVNVVVVYPCCILYRVCKCCSGLFMLYLIQGIVYGSCLFHTVSTGCVCMLQQSIPCCIYRVCVCVYAIVVYPCCIYTVCVYAIVVYSMLYLPGTGCVCVCVCMLQWSIHAVSTGFVCVCYSGLFMLYLQGVYACCNGLSCYVYKVCLCMLQWSINAVSAGCVLSMLYIKIACVPLSGCSSSLFKVVLVQSK